MYFLKKIQKILNSPKMLLTRIQNSVQNVYIVTLGSCDIIKYHYEIFICEINM